MTKTDKQIKKEGGRSYSLQPTIDWFPVTSSPILDFYSQSKARLNQSIEAKSHCRQSSLVELPSDLVSKRNV
jgi:hypothetical protein